MLTERVLFLSLPCNLIIHHNGASSEPGGNMAGCKWLKKCLGGGPPKKLTKRREKSRSLSDAFVNCNWVLNQVLTVLFGIIMLC